MIADRSCGTHKGWLARSNRKVRHHIEWLADLPRTHRARTAWLP
jgi:hypothetical protein